jgi:phage terminase large subunit
MYSDDKHNKTEHVIEVAGNYVEFFSLSDSQKVRGAKRNYLYLNECNEIDYESAQQLFLRTEERVFMDQNPSDAWHWSFKMKDRDDVDYIHSTYKMNPFLTRATVNQIESYKDTDENFWRIYGLGLPGFATTTIYSHWKEYKERDTKVYNEEGGEQPFYDSYAYGLDVGYGHAMALTKCYFKDDTVWVEEVIYQSGLTALDLIKLMNDLNIDKETDIWVDSAAPAMVEDLKRAGYSARSADKSVKEGIDMIKSKRLFVNVESINLISELRRYQWKTKNEQIIYEPVKIADDLCVTGDTIITTKRGNLPITNISVNDMILTRNGWSKCLRFMNNGEKKVIDFIFNKHYKVSATPEHKILVNGIWKEINSVQKGDSLLMRFNMMDILLDYTKIVNIIQDTTGLKNMMKTGNNFYIDMFGQSITEISQKDMMYIIKTRIDSIMIYQIYNLLKQLNTRDYTVKKDILKILNTLKDFVISEENQPSIKNGENLKNVDNITKNYGKYLWENILLNSKQENVKFVNHNIKLMLKKQDFVQISVNQNGEETAESIISIELVSGVKRYSVQINTQKLSFVQEVVVDHIIWQNERNEMVYDIEVEDDHEYFANNILIHNCDSFRYCVWNYYRITKRRDDYDFDIDIIDY